MFQNGPKDGIEGSPTKGDIIPNRPNLISLDNFLLSLTTKVVTPLDISSLAYNSVDFAVGTQENQPYGMTSSSDGMYLFIIGLISEVVFRYDLTTPWDLSTASYNSNSVHAPVIAYGVNLALSIDGLNMYLQDSDANRVYQYTMTSAFDLTTATYTGNSFQVGAQTGTGAGIALASDGSCFLIGAASGAIFKYVFGTPYDISTITYDSTITTSSGLTIRSLQLYNDGTQLITNENSANLQVWNMSTPYDISTLSASGSPQSINGQDNSIRGFAVSPVEDGKVILCGIQHDKFYEYTF